jgi:tRNA (guanine-N1)-methyltransferase
LVLLSTRELRCKVKIQVITIFPEMFEGVLNSSMLWKAQKEKLVEYKLVNLRDFGIGPRKQVDDTPYGGGDGMVLRPEPLFEAVELAKTTDPDARVLLMTPRGDQLLSTPTIRGQKSTEVLGCQIFYLVVITPKLINGVKTTKNKLELVYYKNIIKK